MTSESGAGYGRRILIFRFCRFPAAGHSWTTRKLPIPKAPTIVRDGHGRRTGARSCNQRWTALDSLTATVEIQASVLKRKQGVARDYTTFRGLHPDAQAGDAAGSGAGPRSGTRMFDMASDGKNFSLYIPPKNMAITGLNAVGKKSANQMENLRPGFFFDAMVVRGLEPERPVWRGGGLGNKGGRSQETPVYRS